ncbi:MAG: methionine gamma-lyase family protein [Candidatus Eremiobacteraeota bacterium]|nr:methionine gamma-lyase family protein [Candidatus Eremiobacteraeota bacterium]
MAEEVEKITEDARKKSRNIAGKNFLKVLHAFQEANAGEYMLACSSGYGLHDPGREGLEMVCAKIFKAESSLLRIQLATGTHALACALFGILRPGDLLANITGVPYDTLRPVISGGEGSLEEWGVNYHEIPLGHDGRPDKNLISQNLPENTKMVLIQRTCGYHWRPGLGINDIRELVKIVRGKIPSAIILVDNCYGELVEEEEPLEAGADLVAGSLIKNLGGAIAPGGGYLAGKKDFIQAAASRLTAPGLGEEIGPMLHYARTFMQGLFFSPIVIGQALEGVIWAACLFEKAGFEVMPKWNEHRTDIIQGIKLNSPELQAAFCKGIQKAGPMDSRAIPEPEIQPGYNDPILMAGGTFIQGSSIELSADGPVRPPYAAYLQGGISASQVKLGALLALDEINKIRHHLT